MDTEINIDLNMYVYGCAYVLPNFVHLDVLGTAMLR